MSDTAGKAADGRTKSAKKKPQQTSVKKRFDYWRTAIGIILVACSVLIILNIFSKENFLCIGHCGDGVCQEIVCQSYGCPCPEEWSSCPSDCTTGEAEARRIAVNYVAGTVQYRNFNGYDAVETAFKKLSENSFQFTYEYRINASEEELAKAGIPGVKGFRLTFFVENGKARFVELEEIRSEFCGTSTYGFCQTDIDCITGGCSGQICHSTKEPPSFTTCEYRDCYDSAAYGLKCRCLNNECQWVRA